MCDKDLHQEVVVPAGDLSFAFDAVCRGMALEQADGETAKPGKIVGHVPVARATLVFVEGHVEDPMQLILDAPMAANGAGETWAAEITADDEVPHIVARGAVALLRNANDHADRLDARPLLLQREVAG